MNNLRITTAIKLSWQSLRLNLVRTSLTVLGVIIGVMAIVVVFAAGDGITNLVTSEVAAYGLDIIQISTQMPNKKRSVSLTQITTLTLSDMEAINQLSNIESGYGIVLGQQKASWQNQSQQTFLFGTSATYALIDQKIKLAEGQFFSDEDDRAQALVAVIGYQLKEDLFANQSALGQWIKLGNHKFQVIGVLEERGGMDMLDFDRAVYLPIKTLQKRILGIDYVLYLTHQLKDISRADETAEEIAELLRERHHIHDPEYDDFLVTTMDEMVEKMNTVTGIVTLLLLSIVTIALIVGGIGIMNIMYVTVSERTPEIGLRKALGATYYDIVSQFLVEAVLITVWGSLIGIVFGLITAWLLSLWATSHGLLWLFTIPWHGLGVAVLFALLCGFLFGFRPAKKAALLDPVEALRIE